MKFSLILCTLGRTDEVALFLESLSLQTYQNYELIIIDQNKDDRLKKILSDSSIQDSKILHIVQSVPGLSRARNVGIQHASGNIIAFPDDDCTYDIDVLEKVAFFFTHNSNKPLALSVNTRDINSSFSLIFSPKNECSFSKDKLLGCSFTLFFSKEASNMLFDERLGVGSGFIWGAAEENDFLYRFLTSGGEGYYLPSPTVFHPAKENDTLDVTRAYLYGGGFAAFRLKNNGLVRFIKSSLLIFVDIFKNLILGKWKKASFKFIFLLGYFVGGLAWKIANKWKKYWSLHQAQYTVEVKFM
nr:glycosyltransferase family 2 protein [Providencia rettgeri]